jgi:hypothetical protein
LLTLTPELEQWLDHLELVDGAVPGPNGQACVMQAVAYIAEEPWTDHPECASPIITLFLIRWNDAMNDTDRQMLKPYIPRIVGTRTSSADEDARAWMLTDWLARECAPAWLRLAGLTAHAELLEGLAPIVSSRAALDAQPVLESARKGAAAAGDAAAAAARDAAWAAAWDAAGDAAGAAAGDAAWDAAAAAAWAAAWAAARDAAADAAGDAAGDAAWDAAWAAAWAAAVAALAPTVAELQASALLLLDRMIEAGKQ